MRSRRDFLASSLASCAVEAPLPQPVLFELRSYATAHGRRDDLIALFEGGFLDAYEAGGAQVLGTFRDLDDPDRWTWMRAFAGPRERGDALRAFYSSPIWKREADAANATIADTGNVLLLRRLAGATPDASMPTPRVIAASLIVAEVCVLTDGAEQAFADMFAAHGAPALADLGASPAATFVTDRSENFYPRQIVRPDTVFVTLTRFESADRHRDFVARRDKSGVWRRYAAERARLLRAIETSRLAPTARSRIR